MSLSRNELLILLIEECGEVIQAATKCLRFGYERNEPGYGKNDDVLSKEIGDLIGVTDGLILNRTFIEHNRRNKLTKATAIKDKYGNIDNAHT
jgi:hypothetical protein